MIDLVAFDVYMQASLNSKILRGGISVEGGILFF